MIKPIQLVAIWDDDSNDLISALVYGTKEEIKVVSDILAVGSRRGTLVDYCGWSQVEGYSPNVTEKEGMNYFTLDFDCSEHNYSVREVRDFLNKYL